MYRLTAPCLFGLEKTLSFEIKRAGGSNILMKDGRAFFDGDEAVIAKMNITSSVAERVQIVLGEFSGADFDEIFEGAKNVPIEEFAGKNDAFPVAKGHSLGSKITSIPAIQRTVKKALVERMRDKHKVSALPESGAVLPVHFLLQKDIMLLTLDTSGASLHKRGYRSRSGEAPIRETLAAGIVDLARVKGCDTVCDPFCGSGTFPIEAALMGANIAPGMNREFTAKAWGKLIREKIWQDAYDEAHDVIRHDVEMNIQGYDVDSDIIKCAIANAKAAGVDRHIHFQARDVKDLRHPKHYGFIITNPPYGERLEDKEALPALYRTLGESFQALSDWSMYLITSWEDAEKYIGRKADKNRKIYNGMIKSYYYQFMGPKPPRK